MPANMRPIEGESIRYYISRCSVCESYTQVIAIHSQNTDIPDCPANWYGLWSGYSFFMVSYTFLGSHQLSFLLIAEHWCWCWRQWSASFFSWIMSRTVSPQPFYWVSRSWPLQLLHYSIQLLVSISWSLGPIQSSWFNDVEIWKFNDNDITMPSLYQTKNTCATPEKKPVWLSKPSLI